jgi:UDP-N-acetylglucosamine--N-acetylmuramyl-(pentapeptide) pyrophosphoryl-undecaprenol N-acetylglucosamine transferase
VEKRPIMLAAGGTGGHLFPAFALAEELGRRGYPVELATDMRGDRYGTGFPARKVHRIQSATLGGKSPVAIAKTGFKLSRGIKQAYQLMGETRPAVVVGFGGYPSFPPLLAARMRGIPTVLHEQNAVLGRANRMLAKRVSAIATSFPQVKLLDGALAEKAHFTGNPVRDVVLAAASAAYPAGARFFSEGVPPSIAPLHEDDRRQMLIVQQCREEDLEMVRAAYARMGVRADLRAFFKDLPEQMAAANLVIARAGASTVAELAVIGRPAILVPLPHAVDNDQLNNARRLADAGAAWCVEQKDATHERLSRDIHACMANPGEMAKVAAAARGLGKPDAVARLADLVLGLASQG